MFVLVRVLAAGLSSVVFAAATLALTSVVLLILQRPWAGQMLGACKRARACVYSLFVRSFITLCM